MKPVLAQARMEITLTLRRGESLVVTLLIPLMLLVFLSRFDLAPEGETSIDFLAPGILALAVISTSMVSFGISTGFDRSYGVLKLIGGSPLGRGRLVVAKVLAIGVVQIVQMAILVGVSLALGWDPAGGVAVALIVLAVGSLAFAGLGLLMAGTLRAEGTLALANVLYIVFIAIGGIVFPLSKLPPVVRTVAEVLPAAAFGEALRQAFAGAGALTDEAFVLLMLWAVVLVTAAARAFRWE